MIEVEAEPGTAVFDAAIVDALGGARRELDPGRGVMVRVVWLSGVRNTGRLLLVIHHLAVDGVSWRVLVPELASAFHRIDAGEEPEPSYSGTSVRRWSHALRDIAPDRRVELPRWRSILEGADPLIGTRPLDPRLDTFDSVGRVVADVPVELSDTVLTTLPALFGGSVNDGLVAALALALTQWRQAQGIRTDNVLISMEGHGREAHVVPGADVLHTVGWFTSVFPMRIDLAGIDIAEVMSSAPEAAVVLKRVKEELLGVPDSGIGYGVLRYLDEVGRAELEDLRQPQISFNYLGRFSGTEAGESLGTGHWPGRRSGSGSAVRDASGFGPDVNVVTTEISGAPHIGATIAYPTGVLAERDARAIADLWVQALRALATYAEHSERGDSPRPTST
ncbi:condensation domain-containing protein [Rhodococcus sp. 3Y1]